MAATSRVFLKDVRLIIITTITIIIFTHSSVEEGTSCTASSGISPSNTPIASSSSKVCARHVAMRARGYVSTWLCVREHVDMSALAIAAVLDDSCGYTWLCEHVVMESGRAPHN